MAIRKISIKDIYDREANSLLEARKRTKILHSTGDIDASGDEFEVPFRELLRQRLPLKFYIGNGHIVDSNLNVSPQFDVIIADSSATPILYKGQNGTEYFPYESVYAIGEIKSTYYKDKKFIEYFSNNIKSVKDKLFRKDVPSSYIGNGIHLGGNLTIEGQNDIQNNLFTFMFFGDHNDSNYDEINQQLAKLDPLYHPNIISFLDGSIITKAKIKNENGVFSLSHVVMNPFKQSQDHDLGTIRLNFDNEGKSGQALGMLMIGLFGHLSSSRLYEPPINTYLSEIINIAPYKGELLIYNGEQLPSE